MSEAFDRAPRSEWNLDPRKLIIAVAQDPVTYIKFKRDAGKDCGDAIRSLRGVREEILKDASYAIDNPNPLFAKFYRIGNRDPEHYRSLFVILKTGWFPKARDRVSYYG